MAPYTYDRFDVQATQLDSGPFPSQFMAAIDGPRRTLAFSRKGKKWSRRRTQELDQPDPRRTRDGWAADHVHRA